jgi:hypothetical protein
MENTELPELLDIAVLPAPKHWKHETSGVLKPVVAAYLEGAKMTAKQIRLMRLYLKQWIDSPFWPDVSMKGSIRYDAIRSHN